MYFLHCLYFQSLWGFLGFLFFCIPPWFGLLEMICRTILPKLILIYNQCISIFLANNQFSVQFSSVAQSCPTLCETAAHQASLSITNSRGPPKPMSIKLMMPSNHLILCHPLLLLPSIFPSIRVFSNESALHIRWPKYWSLSFNISPSNEHPGLISFRMD